VGATTVLFLLRALMWGVLPQPPRGIVSPTFIIGAWLPPPSPPVFGFSPYSPPNLSGQKAPPEVPTMCLITAPSQSVFPKNKPPKWAPPNQRAKQSRMPQATSPQGEYGKKDLGLTGFSQSPPEPWPGNGPTAQYRGLEGRIKPENSAPGSCPHFQYVATSP